MSLTRARPLDGRRGRLILDRARNPENISQHAAKRFIEDAHAFGVPIEAHNIFTALRHIREVCTKAKKIYRGKNSHVLHSPPWWIFYRDDTVVTMMHEQSQRKF